MIRSTMIAAAMALAAIASPAMATDFTFQSNNNAGTSYFVAPQISNGGYQWRPELQQTVILPLAFDHTLNFSVATDSLINLNLWQSESGITFSDIFINGVSLVNNYVATIGGMPGTNVGAAYAQAGAVAIRFVGINAGNPHSFGGTVNTQAATIPNVPAVPEPATWAMMVIGIGAIGCMMRRKATNVQFA